MQIAQIFSFVAALALVAGSPLLGAPRAACQCAVCDVGPGDCQGADLDAYNTCVSVVLGECGRGCGDLEPGTGAQEGCYLSNIKIHKPCENKCVQARLRTGLKPHRA